MRVLIPFAASGYLYGMERAVIETFDLLRPEIEPVFVVSRFDGENLPTVRELRRRGMDVAFFSDYKPWPRIEKPRSISQFLRLGWGLLRGNLDIIRNSRGCDALYLPGVLYAAYALVVIARFRLEGRRVLLAHHELAPRFQRRLDFVNALVTDHLHVSEFAREWTIRQNPSILAKNNVVLTHRVDPPAGGHEALRELLDGDNIVCISQLSWTKGIDILLDAFALVRAAHPNAKLHLIGAGGEEFAVGQHVYRWGFRADPGLFLQHATVLVQPTPPSRYAESWGRSSVEAIMTGVPVVCFASGALKDVVRENVTGIVVHKEKAADLAAAILEYLDSPELRARHSANCLADQRFQAGPIREKWLKFFTQP